MMTRHPLPRLPDVVVDHFMFQLTNEETPDLRSQCVTSNAGRESRRYSSYAFTEQGVAMLSGYRLVDRTHRELTDEAIARVAGIYHAWRGDPDAGDYGDIPGFCKGATLEEVRAHGHVLTPGRYVGAATGGGDAEPFAGKMQRLVAQLREQTAGATRLDEAIRRSLKGLGYGA